ncbi:MAG: hypothetical protein WD768_07335 [Phycisphaeraceae bacterium]
MASKQVMLTLALAATLLLALPMAGCQYNPRGAEPLVSPYSQARVWAIVPLRNESGSLHADGVVLADHLQRQLENAANVDVIPVNRVLRAMEVLDMPVVASASDAYRLMETLGVDGLIVGTVTAYDPYDPPKLGISIELFDGGRSHSLDALDVRKLSRAAVDEQSHPYAAGDKPHRKHEGVASGVSSYFNASDSNVRKMLQVYAGNRDGAQAYPDGWHRYRISMDLYSEFVTYVMSWRLLRAEAARLSQVITTESSQALSR